MVTRDGIERPTGGSISPAPSSFSQRITCSREARGCHLNRGDRILPPSASGNTGVKPSQALERHREAIRGIVERHHAANARVFGSALAGDDGDESDLDLLVDPAPRMSLFDIGAIGAEVSELLGVPVDVVTPGALPERWRERVLSEAAPV